ncbi:hypothetical protein HYW21_04690 [Candidatus Woesearchaeota archaeon]|nr:hypothetical protein [Candidatus Woesearchaeota archaeon]
MAFWSILVSGLTYFWGLFVVWLSIFFAPFKNFEMLWIIVPIWINWFFAEWFQEKKSTSFGNAISNGAVVLWVGIDWIRRLVNLIAAGQLTLSVTLFLKFFIAFLALGYGLLIIIEGIKTRQFIHYVGRVRDTTYVLLMLSPFFYDVVDLTWKTTFVMILFFPAWYFIIEAIARYAPNPKTYDDEGSLQQKSMPQDLGNLKF